MNRLDFGLPGVDGKGTKLVAMDHFNAELLIAANRSLHWIFQSFDAYQKRPGTTIGEALAPHVKGSSCELINPGLVLAAAYIYFLYPKETAIHRLNLDSLDTSAFRLDYGSETHSRTGASRSTTPGGSSFRIRDMMVRMLFVRGSTSGTSATLWIILVGWRRGNSLAGD